MIYIVDSRKGRLLVMQRAACKNKAFMRKVPGSASVQEDKDFLESCIREVREEVSIHLKREQLYRFTDFKEWGDDWCVLGYWTTVDVDKCGITL